MVNRLTPPDPVAGYNDIGGAVVRRRFNTGGRDYVNGEILTEAMVRSFKESNLRAMRSSGIIQVFPKPRSGAPLPAAPARGVEFVKTT